MCSEIDRFPSFLRRMSDNRQQFPVERKDDKEEISITSEPETAAVERESGNLEDGGGDHQEKIPEEIKKEKEDEATASRREIDEEDDGFKTPTSSAHKIPAITECPPPPVKPRPPPSKLKRKASPPQNSAAEVEVESIFAPIESDQEQHKIKKARTEDKDRS